MLYVVMYRNCLRAFLEAFIGIGYGERSILVADNHYLAALGDSLRI